MPYSFSDFDQSNIMFLCLFAGFLERFILKEGMDEKTHGKLALGIMIVLVLGLMQATHYAKASHLMGAFIAGLVFCTDHELHLMFVSQFKRILQVGMEGIFLYFMNFVRISKIQFRFCL